VPTSTISPDGLWTVTEQVAPSGPFIVSVPPGQTASLNNPPVELVIVNVNVWDAHAGVTVVLQMMVPFALKPITWVPVGQEVPAALLGPGGPVGPAGPVAPVAPGGPCGPVAPVSPFGPVGPVAPVGPCGPVWLQLIAISGGRQLSPALRSITRRLPTFF
jgi:hypothetical protein